MKDKTLKSMKDTKTKNQTITVKVSENEPEELQLIAKSIIELSEAFKKIEKSTLKRKTIVLLLQDLTKLPQRDINLVLDVAPKLAQFYLKEIPKTSK